MFTEDRIRNKDDLDKNEKEVSSKLTRRNWKDNCLEHRLKMQKKMPSCNSNLKNIISKIRKYRRVTCLFNYKFRIEKPTTKNHFREKINPLNKCSEDALSLFFNVLFCQEVKMSSWRPFKDDKTKMCALVVQLCENFSFMCHCLP